MRNKRYGFEYISSMHSLGQSAKPTRPELDLDLNIAQDTAHEH